MAAATIEALPLVGPPAVVAHVAGQEAGDQILSSDSCLDFFFQVVPSTSPQRVAELLELAWDEDAATALKLVFQLRAVRGTGKSDKERFYAAARWLYHRHPATLLANLRLFPAFGYYKDLLELVLRVLEGPKETWLRMEMKEAHDEAVRFGKFKAKAKEKTQGNIRAYKMLMRSYSGGGGGGGGAKIWEGGSYKSRKGAAARAAKEEGSLRPQAERIAAQERRNQALKEEARPKRRIATAELARRVVEKYSQGSRFKLLHSAVAQIFADQLAKDLQALEKQQQQQQQKKRSFEAVSLAAKFAPSLDQSYDKRTLMCEAIARRLFPKSSSPDYAAADLEDAHYAFRVRDRLRKEVLVPLRRHLELPYNRVASVAMKNYKEIFEKKDAERFKSFLEDVEADKAKIAAGALLPHQIVQEAVEKEGTGGEATMVSELQWRRLVEDLKKKGALSNCLPVCDVSGSMAGLPMEVCVALGLLVSDLCEEPWKNHIMSFSAQPQLHTVP